MKPEEFKKIINFDSLAEAEKITGKSYKEDKHTSDLGLGLHLIASKNKQRLLIGMNDTHFNMTEDEFLQICKQNKFEIILKEPFINEDGIEERLYCLFNYENSLLIKFDTYTITDTDGSFKRSGTIVPPPRVNGGTMYFNFAHKKYESTSGFHFSGGYAIEGKQRDFIIIDKNSNKVEIPKELVEPIWDDKTSYHKYLKLSKEYNELFDMWFKSGDYYKIYKGSCDIREGLMYSIREIKKGGFFTKTWVEQPFLWILHYMDTKTEGWNDEELTNKRISKFPVEVQKAIGFIK